MVGAGYSWGGVPKGEPDGTGNGFGQFTFDNQMYHQYNIKLFEWGVKINWSQDVRKANDGNADVGLTAWGSYELPRHARLDAKHLSNRRGPRRLRRER